MADAELVEQLILLGHEPHARLGIPRHAATLIPEYANFAFRRQGKSEHEFEQRGLAGTVFAQHPNYIAGLDTERELLQHARRAICLTEV
ncbi:MAG TPA: hypothetical protein VIY90_20410 [Steroidobacteraceae bacterium]